MSFERINPPGLGTPRGFSHAVATSRSRTVYLAGQTSLDAEGRIIGTTVVEQFAQALTRLLAALEAAGGSPEDLTTVTIYMVDVEDYLAHSREIGATWKRLAGTEYPAMAGIGVSRLWDADALVEIQGIAALS